MSEQECMKYPCFSSGKLIIFKCGFSILVTCKFLLQKHWMKLSELNLCKLEKRRYLPQHKRLWIGHATFSMEGYLKLQQHSCFQVKKVFASNSILLITSSLQPDGANLWHWIAKIQVLENPSLWQRLNSLEVRTWAKLLERELLDVKILE